MSRREAVLFECDRCGEEAQDRPGVALPENWQRIVWTENESGAKYLCETCARSFNEFMKRGDGDIAESLETIYDLREKGVRYGLDLGKEDRYHDEMNKLPMLIANTLHIGIRIGILAANHCPVCGEDIDECDCNDMEQYECPPTSDPAPTADTNGNKKSSTTEP